MKHKFLIISILIIILLSMTSLAITTDEFNRPDSDLLEFGWNETTNINCNGEIVNNTLRIIWTGDRGGDCNVWHPGGQETIFDFETSYRAIGVGSVIGTAVTINGDADIAFFTEGTSFEHTTSTHRVWNTAGNLTVTGIAAITQGVWYQARFKYDGINLSTKIWFNGTPEPDTFNFSRAFANIDTGINLVLGENDNNAGEVRFDYVRDIPTAINIDAVSPKNDTVFNLSIISISANVSSTENYKLELFINGTLNQSKDLLAFNTSATFDISFNEGHFSYFFNASNSTEAIFDISGTSTFIVDTITPVIGYTTPSAANDTIVNSSKSITLDISVTNTNLHLFVFNVTNSSGSILFSNSSTTLNGTSSLSVTNIVNLENQSEQTFTASMFVCDIIFNCANQVVTFTMDSTSPIVTNTAPDNNTMSAGGSTGFVFSTSEVGLCSLQFNGTTQETINVSIGNNSFTDIDFNSNISVSWNSVCSDNFGNNATSGAFIFTVDIVEVKGLFTAGNCPNTSIPDILTFAFLTFFLITMLVINIVHIKIPALTFIIGLGFIPLGKVIAGCSGILGLLTFVIAVFIMMFGAFGDNKNSPSGGEM